MNGKAYLDAKALQHSFIYDTTLLMINVLIITNITHCLLLLLLLLLILLLLSSSIRSA